jgi:D-glycero-alpha-D-manno-heptose-7-phosphate kinase
MLRSGRTLDGCRVLRWTFRWRSPPSATFLQAPAMGSSSTLTVGLLAALYGYRNRVVSSRLLAEQACQIEIEVLGKPIGRQDQYAAGFGGLNYIRFNPDATIDVEPVPCWPETMAELERQTLLVYTGQTRDANVILER